jgi:hypothetical protein
MKTSAQQMTFLKHHSRHEVEKSREPNFLEHVKGNTDWCGQCVNINVWILG